MTSLIPARTESELLEVNRHFYNALWRDARLIEPERFNTCPLVRSLLAPAGLSGVAGSGAALMTSVPLHPAKWSGFDAFVGHRHRYEPTELRAKLARHGFAVERSAAFGMMPKSSRLVDLGIWFLIHQRE